MRATTDGRSWVVNVVAGVIHTVTMPLVALATARGYFDARVRDELAPRCGRGSCLRRSSSPRDQGRVGCGGTRRATVARPEMSSGVESVVQPTGWTRRRIFLRCLLLVVTLVSLYLLMPSLLEVFTSWRELLDLRPEWVVAAIGFEAASFVAIWQLLRVALHVDDWFVVATSQLAGNALGRIVPGGMATAGALQYRMLTRVGVAGGSVASGITASSALSFATLLALPVLAVPAILAGAPVDRGLLQSLWVGLAAFVLLVAVGVAAFAFHTPLHAVGRTIEWLLNRTVRRRSHMSGLPERLLSERDAIRRILGARWRAAMMASVGRWLLDYLALIAALWAVGANPRPSLVLLAYVAASFLGMIPLTPGGLGFVEAGLTGTLALAGVAAGPAVLATLAYRLVSFWLPIPLGGAAWWLFRRRYPDRAGDSLATASARLDDPG